VISEFFAPFFAVASWFVGIFGGVLFGLTLICLAVLLLVVAVLVIVFVVVSVIDFYSGWRFRRRADKLRKSADRAINR
jgi:membrane protein implicated in regulation of membrane protease activity